MFHENPYKTTLVSETSLLNETAVEKDAKELDGRLVALWWIAYLHPVIILVLVYSLWAITAASLGHPPNFGEYTDNYLIDILGIGCFLFFLATPVLVPSMLVWGWVHPFARRPTGELIISKRIACLITYMFVCASAVILFNFDPFKVVVWLMD
ncbi:MAG: hypothetical protein GY818_09980 [Planctomycetaceae bacterium]|nr:hypothetical protein [Planctomycetaceae bacterium]